jgi:hypothetical protein
MKSLATLIKLQKTYVDEQRLVLARLQEHLEQIEQEIAAHEIAMTREQIAAQNDEQARFAYGAYVKAAVAQARILEKGRQTAVESVEIARVKLSELFEEQKRYEIAQAAREEAAAAEQRKLDRLELDEVGSVQFTRKKDE